MSIHLQRQGQVSHQMALDNQAEIKVCRVCLAIDVKMYDMKDFKLSEMFKNVTGIAICDDTERLLHHVCWECTARLTAASAFKDKALFSDTLLKNLAHRNKRDIERLKQSYSRLKSTLTIQTVFTSADIACGDTPIELHRETKKENVYKRKTRRKSNIEEEGTVFHEEEPLIGIPVKTEIEPDPIAENIQIKDVKSEKFAELTNFDDSFTSSNEDSDDEIRNTEERIDNNEKSEDIEMSDAPIKYEIDAIDNIFEKSSSEDTEMNNETIDDSDIGSAEVSAEKRPKLDVVENIYAEHSSEGTEMTVEPGDASDIVVAEENPTLDDIDESSSEEDAQTLAELVTAKKVKKKKGRTVRSNKLNDLDKQKIIALKEKGLSMPEIAEKTGKTINCITSWWQRYNQEDSDVAENGTEESEPEQNDMENSVESCKLGDYCPQSVREKLLKAGFEHILKKKSNNMNTGQKASMFTAKRQLIIALKQERVNHTDIAQLLEINRNVVTKWWTRWCNEGYLGERKRSGRKRKTTSQEDQLILDRVAQSESIHIRSLGMEFGISPSILRKRLREAGFKHQFRGPYIPMKKGRTKNVDEDLKQRILTMKHNGVSVTEMAIKFGVPRTTIYHWWQRWCKENNTNDTIEEEQALAEDDKNEQEEKTPKKLSTKKALDSKVEQEENTPKKLSTKKVSDSKVEKEQKTPKKLSTKKASDSKVEKEQKTPKKLSTKKILWKKKPKS